jgi:hypothetical protein
MLGLTAMFALSLKAQTKAEGKRQKEEASNGK